MSLRCVWKQHANNDCGRFVAAARKRNRDEDGGEEVERLQTQVKAD